MQTHHGPNERLYLAPMFGKLLVSGARRAEVYSLEHGVSLNTVNYYKYKRMSREIEKGISHDSDDSANVKTVLMIGDPETSPYAQTGVSVWDLRRLTTRTEGEQLERLVVVHDVERLNPLVCDVYTISRAALTS